MIHSDLEADNDKCPSCGNLLLRNFGGYELYPTLRMYDGDIVDAVVADIWCSNCGYVNEVFWMAQLPASANIRRLSNENIRNSTCI